jgi:hypothetical protein
LAHELYPGLGVAVRATLARHAPGQIKRFYAVKHSLRQVAKRLLYRRQVPPV